MICSRTGDGGPGTRARSRHASLSWTLPGGLRADGPPISSWGGRRGSMRISMCRCSAAINMRYERSWAHGMHRPRSLHLATKPGRFVPGAAMEALDLAIHDVWCRPTAIEPWALQLMIGDTD